MSKKPRAKIVVEPSDQMAGGFVVVKWENTTAYPIGKQMSVAAIQRAIENGVQVVTREVR